MTVDRTISSRSRIYKTIIFGITFVLVCFALTGSGVAAPAAPAEHTLSQPDGTTFNATQWGNEDNHGWQTARGYTITQGPDDWWWYATVEAGELVPTDNKARIDAPPESIKKELRGAARTSTRYQSGEIEKSAQTDIAGVEPTPSTGTVKYPVILITYPDKNTTASTGDFQQLLYGDDPAEVSGPGSMRDYYLEASNGQLRLNGSVSAWVTADNEHDYYRTDRKAAELAYEAVTKADDQIDYSQYDNNGDGYVDGVIIIHQGGGQEATGNPTDIWSHRWSFVGASYYGASVNPYISNDGVTINDYSINPETYGGEVSTVGIFAHETGHLLGMTDLYDTDGSSEGIGEWGLMGSGSWNYAESFSPQQGNSPAHPVAFHKWQQGWITPTRQPLTGSMGTLEPYANTSDTFQWLENPRGAEIGGSGEYFLATYRQQTGFDQGLPGEGVLITHIDETQESNRNENRKLVDIEAADGRTDLDVGRNRGDPGDPFPSQGREGFGPNTNPNSRLYDGSQSGLQITEFKLREDRAILNPTPQIRVQPAEGLRFSATITNEAGGYDRVEKNVTILNDGTGEANLTNISIKGVDAGNFTIQDNVTGQSLNPGEAATIGIGFESIKNGTYSATLVIAHTAPGTPEKITLRGTRGVTSPVDQYDNDQDGIETPELLNAINDYRSSVLPATDLIPIIKNWRTIS